MKSKRYRSIVVVALATILVLAATVFTCVRYAGKAMSRYSCDVLAAYTRQLARDYYETIRADQTALQAMAELLSYQESGDTEAALRIMTSFDLGKTFLDALELMTPDNRMLDQNGEWFDLDDDSIFEAEAAKGAYVSDRVTSFRDPELLIGCDVVPVVRNGEIAAMLYGIVPLAEKSKKIDVDYYDGHAYMMLVDGSTGDVLLDTWHDTLGNLSDLSGHKMLKGYSYELALQNMRAGVGGDMRLVSSGAGEVMYLHYEPVGVNNWSVILSVSEEKALAGTRSSMRALYWMAAVVGVTLIGCMIFIAACLLSDRRRMYRMTMTDQGTGLLNRRAYQKFLSDRVQQQFALAACVYLDANGLHEINNKYGHDAGDKMLCAVADCLRAQFQYSRIFRVGGDEFVVFPADADRARCEAKLQKVADAIAEHDYTMSYGVVCHRDVTGLDTLVREVDEKMLENKRAYYAEHDRRKPR